VRKSTFTYQNRNEPSLLGVSLSIRYGEVIALVGENGSGKTTLTKILAGPYQPSTGIMRWDCRDAVTLEPAALRTHVTRIVPDFARCFLTAHENIAISRISDLADEGGVPRAAVLADALLSRCRTDTERCSDRLLRWQRPVARAPPGSIPGVSARSSNGCPPSPRGHTGVLVSHRFSSVRAADRILASTVAASSRVWEGSHEELPLRDGLYHEL
jgi:ATP-binding cassette, subfamily B, bacterial